MPKNTPGHLLPICGVMGELVAFSSAFGFPHLVTQRINLLMDGSVNKKVNIFKS